MAPAAVLNRDQRRRPRWLERDIDLSSFPWSEVDSAPFEDEPLRPLPAQDRAGLDDSLVGAGPDRLEQTTAHPRLCEQHAPVAAHGTIALSSTPPAIDLEAVLGACADQGPYRNWIE